MSRDEIEDGMGFAGLAPSPAERREERERTLLRDLIRSRDHDIEQLQIALRKDRAENVRLRTALGKIAAKNDLSEFAGHTVEVQASGAFAALHECELIAREALNDEQSQKTEG